MCLLPIGQRPLWPRRQTVRRQINLRLDLKPCYRDRDRVQPVAEAAFIVIHTLQNLRVTSPQQNTSRPTARLGMDCWEGLPLGPADMVAGQLGIHANGTACPAHKTQQLRPAERAEQKYIRHICLTQAWRG